MQNPNVTYLDDLPELADETSGGHPGSHGDPLHGVPERFHKFIRPSMGSPPPESGMANYSSSTPYPSIPPSYGEPMLGPSMGAPSPQPKVTQMPDGSPSCLQVADHIANCPLCSKFYKNDQTIYIVVIVLLAIVCLLLLKRVLKI